MRITEALRRRFHEAGYFTTPELAAACGIGKNMALDHAALPKVRVQLLDDIRFIEARSWAETFPDAPIVMQQVDALLRSSGVVHVGRVVVDVKGVLDEVLEKRARGLKKPARRAQ